MSRAWHQKLSTMDRPCGLRRVNAAIFPKQPDHYRPPEATLGYGWHHSSDIWMLGVLVSPLSFESNKRKFELRSTCTGMRLHRMHGTVRALHHNDTYCALHHLAEMIALLDPPPEELIATSDRIIEKELLIAVRR